MSDFLRNLRSSHKKDPSDPRRSMDGHFYPKNDRRKLIDRRAGFSSPESGIDTLIEEVVAILPMISDNSKVFSSFVEHLEIKTDKLIESQIRQQTAVATFFENLNAFIESESLSLPQTPVRASTSYASGTRYTKDEVLATMKSLRDKGATFAQIADHLTQKGIPTFSGKGQWHAQTIHRLCK